MSMENEWKELKDAVKCGRYRDKYMNANTASGQNMAFQEVLDKMIELEKRNLPERVADAIEKISHERWIQGAGRVGQSLMNAQAKMIIKALRTGDTSELEKWQK